MVSLNVMSPQTVRTMNNDLIETIIKTSAQNFKRMLDNLYPAQGNNGFNERNISFQIANAFQNLYKNGNVFMELPLFNSKEKRWSYHVDGYFFTDEIGIFYECKRLYSAEKLDSIRYDVDKLQPKNVEESLKEMAEIIPKDIYVLIVADTWSNGIREWWLDGTDDNKRWDRTSFMNGFITGFQQVKEYKDWKYDNTLYWLYGYKKIKLPGA